MYNLGEQFKINKQNAIANPKNIIKGNKYRFTILSDGLIRLEYSEKKVFLDSPTQVVLNRNMEPVSFEAQEDDRFLIITTKNFKLTYEKEQPFIGTKFNQTKNLKIDLLNTDKYWYYDHPEVRNYMSPGYSLDDNKKKYDKGLYSTDGFVSIDDSNSYVFDEEGNLIKREVKETDIYVFMYLNDFDSCLKDYFNLTGYPPLIPRYALGNWWSRDTLYTDVNLKKLLDTFGEKNIPLSVLLLNHDWHIKNESTSGFTWNKEVYKYPESMIKYMHNINIHMGLSINPFDGIYDYEQYYEQIKQYLQPDKKGVIPFNTYDSKTLDVYFKMLIHPLDNMGVDFYFIDHDNEKTRDELGVLNHYQFMDIKKDFNKRPMILSRNSSLTPHRYPILYSGKTIVGWNTLNLIPYFNNMAANKGVVFWAHDIGGFYKGIEDNELYTRFIQLGTFSPILKLGCDSGKYYKREPWRWGIKTYTIVKDFLNLRHRLIPYLYTESYKYHKFGIPIIKPIYYKYPNFYDDMSIRNEYFFGSELFVAPIVKSKEYIMNRVIHKFFVPDGTWYDFFTGKKFPGGRSYVSFFKDEDYPVFAKSGSIITLSSTSSNDTSVPKSLEFHIFPGRSNTYNLYEDDGLTCMYEKGNYLLTSIDYNYLPNNYTVIIRPVDGKNNVVPEKRDYKFRFRNTKKADEVLLYFNDTKVECTSYTDGTDFIVEVKDAPTDIQVTLNCKGKDIEIDAVRLINEDIESIISDLQIDTEMKLKIDNIMFSNLPVNKKRIGIRKLQRKGLEKKFVKLFLKLLEYVKQV